MTDSPNDRENDYLWTGAGVVDPEVARLERVLGKLRYRGTELRTAVPSRRLPRRALATAAVITVSACAAWFGLARSGGDRIDAESWSVDPGGGIVTIGTSPISTPGALPVGAWLETDAEGRVELDVADIGHVTVHPGSRLRITDTRAGEQHRVELARGRIEAFIFAPPRLFFVDTPAAVAVDLGCVYELEVDERGNGALAVSLGWVMLENGAHSVTVPSDARCPISADRGPGTPRFDDAPPAFVEAITILDGSVDDEALGRAIETARARDRLTLFHLLPRVDMNQRARLLAAMTTFAPLPPGVDEEGVMTLNRASLDTWWNALDRAW